MKNVLDFNYTEAREFFLKDESYCTFELPEYFKFSELLNSDGISKSNHDLKKAADCEDVNYKIWHNKDGEYSWRLFQLIHPVLYVSLVNRITEKDNWNDIVERFKKNFQSNRNIICTSLPVEKSKDQKSDKAEQISNWWSNAEQRSIELSLEYDHLFQTDIVDCYGSIYTHAIAWALHGKKEAKKNRNNSDSLGNQIDKILRAMANGQTNGIPQGSALMNFIAEMVLGYIDIELSKKIAEEEKERDEKYDYKIIRHRDDYRIFVNNPEVGKRIIKELSNVLSKNGMRIKPEKTSYSSDVIHSSIKPDKLFWLTNRKTNKNLIKELLIFRELSRKYPHSGTLIKVLEEFHEKIETRENITGNIDILISIIVDIAFRNPRTYPIAAAILSKFISSQEGRQAMHHVDKIVEKFKRLPNTEHLDLWLQRITLKIDKTFQYKGALCKRVGDAHVTIWNSKWLDENIQDTISSIDIIDREYIEDMGEIISIDEVNTFGENY